MSYYKVSPNNNQTFCAHVNPSQLDTHNHICKYESFHIYSEVRNYNMSVSCTPLSIGNLQSRSPVSPPSYYVIILRKTIT